MKRKLVLNSILLLLFLVSCNKEKTIQITEDKRVPGNVIPPYNGVTTLQVSNYVHRLYIDLIGEEPSETELQLHVNSLESNHLSDDSRISVIRLISSKNKYYDQLFSSTSQFLTGGVSFDNMEKKILEQEYIRDLLFSSGDLLSSQIIDFEIGRLQKLVDSKEQIQNDEIQINQFYLVFCYNQIYDQINMGSKNFVVACFENLFNRYPTESELETSIGMVEGNSQLLLLKDGNSKFDFLQILMENQEFYSGYVINRYRVLLGREPTPEELGEDVTSFLQHMDFKKMEQKIVSSNEYADF